MEPSARDEGSEAIVVVIPTLNEVMNIAGVVCSLRNGLVHRNVRLVVCDGGSTDGTQKVVERLHKVFPEVSLMHNPERLQSAAVNRVARDFGGRASVLVRCDAHAIYPEGYVSRLVQSMSRHRADAVVVPMDTVGDTCVRRAVAWVSDTPLGSGGAAHRGGRRSGFVDHGHHAAFRMRTFMRSGGYDESFSHNEDAELDCRQRARGGRIYLDADIRLGYLPRASLGALWYQYVNYGAGRSRTVRRHPGSMRRRQLAVPLNAVGCLLSLLLLPVTIWAAAWPLAYLGALTAASVLMAVRHRSACGLLCGPAAAVMHMGWAYGFLRGLLTRREAVWDPAKTPPLAPTRAVASAGYIKPPRPAPIGPVRTRRSERSDIAGDPVWAGAPATGMSVDRRRRQRQEQPG